MALLISWNSVVTIASEDKIFHWEKVEDDRYSDEFRAWCFKEIEKIIGRPLTDDDIMFKDEVLRCRAKRLIDRIPNAWNESVVSFTNIAYKASAASHSFSRCLRRAMETASARLEAPSFS